MEIILFNNYGGLVPDIMSNKIDWCLPFVQQRSDKKVIEWVKTHAVKLEEDQLTDDWFKKNKNGIAYTVNPKSGFVTYHAMRKDRFGYNNCVSFTIVDVDTSKRWTLSTYDGSEGIKYIDNYICSDKEANYWVRNI